MAEVMDHVATATYIETFYWEHNRYPTLDEVIAYSNWSQAQLELISEPINKQLQNRGHPPFNFKTKKKVVRKELDPKFVAACVVVCDPHNKASLAAKLKLAGLKTTEWQVLLNDPMNQKYFQRRMAKVFEGAEESAKLSLVKNIEAADLQSIKYYHEMTGIYRPNTETLLNMGVLLSQLMEILAKFVSKEILLQVADQFERVITAQAVEEPEPVKAKLVKNELLPEGFAV